MIIDNEIRELAYLIEDVEDLDPSTAQTAPAIRSLIRKIDAVCARSENKPDLRQNSTPGFQPYPVDTQGYAVSFDPLTQEAEFMEAWQRHGMVVGKGIVSAEKCERTIADIKARFNAISRGTCDLDNPASWNAMPVDNNGTPLLSRGFLEIYHDNALAKLRQNIRAYLQHVLIWRRADLWVSFDRVGVKLPHHEESKALPLHVDQNPNVHPDFKTIQGVLALTDCPAERGTFMGVPGSRDYFPQYAGMAKNMGEYVELDIATPVGRELQSHAQVIPLRQGDMLSWDSRTTHANTENTSDKMRMVFYMSAGPAKAMTGEEAAARREALKTGLGSNVREAIMHASKKPRFTDEARVAQTRQAEKLNLLGKVLYGAVSYDEITAPPAP